MIEGISGLLTISPPWMRPVFEPSNRRLVWPNGAQADMYSAEKPDSLRGPNHDFAWCDELCGWDKNTVEDTYDILTMTLRIAGPKGDPPQEIISTTPKPLPLLRKILANEDTVVTGGSTFDNVANLDKKTLEYLIKKYGNTRRGRQELYAEVLDAFEGALWSQKMLDDNRRGPSPDPLHNWTVVWTEGNGCYLKSPESRQHFFKRLVVAIDPAGSANRKANETGIIVAGVDFDDHGYVLDDRSGVYAPEQWGRISVELYQLYRADRIIAETNYGGAMVQSVLRAIDPNAPFRELKASVGKRVRAEPVAALDEQGKIHHCAVFKDLEDQLVTWDPLGNGDSPDRLDARVWAFTDLMLKKPGQALPYRRGFYQLPIYRR